VGLKVRIIMVDDVMSPFLEEDEFEPRAVHVTVTAANQDSALCQFEDSHGKSVRGIMPLTEFFPAKMWQIGHTYVALQCDSSNKPLLSIRDSRLVEAVLAGVSPEVRSGQVRVMSVARRAGQRTKVAVASTQEGVDPVAACVGRAHNRVDEVKDALGGEQVDIVAWHPSLEVFLSNALQPAHVESVVVDEDHRSATAAAPSHQMSAAVGGGGLNSALAGELVGLTVRIVEA
jgi:N utilization substance protein A